MEKPKSTELVAKIVDILEPLSPEERRRVIGASFTLLGDEPPALRPAAGTENQGQIDGSETGLPTRARVWMKQNQVSLAEIQQVFHIDNGAVEVIGDVPGKNAKEKVLNAYVMTGLAKLLQGGDLSFDDKTARNLCKTAGCFDNTNHAKYLNDKGNEFAGSKEKGWTLTAPGLKRGAVLVKELGKGE